MKRLLQLDWDVIAGITAAVAAIVLHLLHVVEADVIFTVVLVLVAILLFRDLRRESEDERLHDVARATRHTVDEIRVAVQPPDAVLIGPRHLRAESRRFCEIARGDMVWFNVCFLMFRSPDVFDLMLRPAIDNPLATSIDFIASDGERALWEEHVRPQIQACAGHAKVREPRWAALPETVSFILADVDETGHTEALLSFWGEPFMSRTTARQVPRYVFRVQAHSDLVTRLVEMARQRRMEG